MSEKELRSKIAKLEATIKVLEQDLIHDKLTGLKTRAFFEQEAKIYFEAVNSSLVGDVRRKEWFGFSNLSFIFFDLDKFKSINDILGHSAGDEVLKSVAEVIKTSVREGDTAARWGGEEIVLTLVGATERDAFHKAEDIRGQVERTRFGRFPDLSLTISGGVAAVVPGASFDVVLENADKALLAAKRSGRNKIVAFSEIS